MSRAIVALNSSSVKMSYKEVESELKDKLEVSRIQEKIYQTLMKFKPKYDPIVDAIEYEFIRYK